MLRTIDTFLAGAVAQASREHEDSPVYTMMNAQIQHAQRMISYLTPDQVSAVVHLMEVMLDPVARALANAPDEDEEISAEEEQALVGAREWFKHNPGIPFKQVVAQLGFTMLGFTMDDATNYQDPS